MQRCELRAARPASCQRLLGFERATLDNALPATTHCRWKASGDGMTEGLFYREPEGQLSMYAQVS